MDSIKGLINNWLAPQFGDNLFLDYDADDIEALSVRRKDKYISLQPVTFLTVNEKRAQVGYDNIEGGDVLETVNVQDGSSNGVDETNNQADEESAGTETTTEETDISTDEKTLERSEKESTYESEIDASWKSFNLLNAREKRTSWARQNRRRKLLENSFYRDLKSDFDDLTRRLTKRADSLKGSDVKLIEFALLNEIGDFSPDLEKTLKRHIRYTLEDFGNVVFGNAKSLGIGKETKANLKYDSFITEYINQHTGDQVKTINSTNEKNVKRIISE
jgi:hypothetical protein